MRKLTAFDTIERVFMEATPEEFGQLEERVATIKRLRSLTQPKTSKPRAAKSDGKLTTDRIMPNPMFEARRS